MRFSGRWMVAALSCLLSLGLGALLLGPGAHGASGRSLSRAQARAAYGRLPLSFVRNEGQASPRFRYTEASTGLAIGLGRGQVQLTLARTRGSHRRDATLTIHTPGGRLGRPVASQRLPGVVNYLIGDNRAKWVQNAPTFGRVGYDDVWPGIGLSFHGHQGVLEYDITLAPGANPKLVALRFAGARGVRATRDGGALLTVPGGHLALQAPRAVQNGHMVASRLLVAGGEVRLTLGAYDHREPLLVDPNLTYSTYLGSPGENTGIAIAIDSSRDAYITGDTPSTNFPTTAGAYQTANAGGDDDTFVTTGTLRSGRLRLTSTRPVPAGRYTLTVSVGRRVVQRITVGVGAAVTPRP